MLLEDGSFRSGVVACSNSAAQRVGGLDMLICSARVDGVARCPAFRELLLGDYLSSSTATLARAVTGQLGRTRAVPTCAYQCPAHTASGSAALRSR